MKDCGTLYLHTWQPWGGWDEAREWTYVRCAVCLSCTKLSRVQVVQYRGVRGTAAWARSLRERTRGVTRD